LEREGIDNAKKILTIARDGGINLFDNAETYGNPMGEAERIFGQAYKELSEEDADKWRRTDVLITTKIFWGGTGLNERGLSRKHIMEGMEASLKRLQLEYVDLVFCHRPDSLTPTETVVRAMTDVVRSGKAMAWGTSEWPAQKITEAYWIAKMEGLEPPQFEQPQYNLFHRDRVEKEFSPMYERPYNIGLTTWSPLASGLLTGKYNDTSNIPEDSRAKQQGYTWLEGIIEQWEKEGKLEKVKELTEYANTKLDCTMADLALAWCVKNPHVSCVLLGATKTHQIEANLKALEVVEKLTDEHLEALEKILDNKPGSVYGNGNRQIPTI
jgi:voltage-dependent potassium channel beta subunit